MPKSDDFNKKKPSSQNAPLMPAQDDAPEADMNTTQLHIGVLAL